MRKTIALLLLLISIRTTAQFKVIAQSEDFQEREFRDGKIIQLKNGNTAFIYNGEGGLQLIIYDAGHKKKLKKHLDIQRSGMMDAVLEINGHLVLFINSNLEKETPKLYRVIIDGNTGAVNEEKIIAEAATVRADGNLNPYFLGKLDSEFFIRKNTSNDFYAVSVFNGEKASKDKRLQVILFSSDHKELGKAWFSLQGNNHEFVEYLDMAFTGKGNVCVLGYTFNKRQGVYTDNELVLGELNAEAGEFKLYPSNFLKDHVIEGGLVRYNPVTNKLILLALSKENTTTSARTKNKITSYAAYTAIVAPTTYEMEAVLLAYPEKVNEKSHELFGDRNNYDGLPQDMIIHSDGFYSVIYEEITEVLMLGNSGPVSSTLAHLAITMFDLQGREINSYYLPKAYKPGPYFRPFFHAKHQQGSQVLLWGAEFRAFTYLEAGDKKYILYNDVMRNEELIAKGKYATINGVAEIDGFSFRLSGKNMIPQRQYIFGEPVGRQHQLAAFMVSDYNQEKNIYVTLRMIIDGNKKTMQVVWLQPR